MCQKCVYSYIIVCRFLDTMLSDRCFSLCFLPFGGRLKTKMNKQAEDLAALLSASSCVCGPTSPQSPSIRGETLCKGTQITRRCLQSSARTVIFEGYSDQLISIFISSSLLIWILAAGPSEDPVERDFTEQMKLKQ